MKRKVISIDDAKCNGCGECVTACAENALQIVDGKARIVKDQFCDGFGDCIGECPTGALTIETRETDPFNYESTRRHVGSERGADGLKRLEQAAQAHHRRDKAGATAHPAGGCPGRQIRGATQNNAPPTDTQAGATAQAIRSELSQWPIQLHLVPADAPFFKNRELVLISTCAPVASADIHWRFIRGRAVSVACPKLDRIEDYARKLAAILAEPSIPGIIVVRMEVPCCGGLVGLAKEAAALAKRNDIRMEEVIVGLNGDIQPAHKIQ